MHKNTKTVGFASCVQRKDISPLVQTNIRRSVFTNTIAETSHERNGVSNPRYLDCASNSLFRLTSEKTSTLRSFALCEGNPSETGRFEMRKTFSCHHFVKDVQRTVIIALQNTQRFFQFNAFEKAVWKFWSFRLDVLTRTISIEAPSTYRCANNCRSLEYMLVDWHSNS